MLAVQFRLAFGLNIPPIFGEKVLAQPQGSLIELVLAFHLTVFQLNLR